MIRVLETRNVPDSMLFTGACEKDILDAGFFVAKALNCHNIDQNPCLICSSCKKIQAKTHPDIIHVELPEGKKEISIAQVREVESLVNAKPNEADWRMIMISLAHKMTVQAQNALLKILEEPPLKTFFILTAPDSAGLLPTILSRCRIIPFKSIKPEELAAILENKYSVDSQEARESSLIAGGDMKKAMLLLNLFIDGSQEDSCAPSCATIDWKSRHKWILDQMEAWILGNGFFPNQEVLATARILSQEPENIPVWFMIFGAFFHDMLVCKDYPDGIIHRNRMQFFQLLIKKLSPKKILGFLDLFHDTEKRLSSNVSVRLTMERFCFALCKGSFENQGIE